MKLIPSVTLTVMVEFRLRIFDIFDGATGSEGSAARRVHHRGQRGIAACLRRHRPHHIFCRSKIFGSNKDPRYRLTALLAALVLLFHWVPVVNFGCFC